MKTTSIWVLLTMAVLAVAAPTASDAKPAATCKSMCQRLTDCKMGGYTKMCLDACKQYGYEATEEGRAQLLTFTKYSCKQIQSAIGATAGNQAQSSPRSAPARNAPARSSSARPPAPSNPYEGDDDDYDYDDGSRPTAGRSDRAQRSYQSTSGNDSGDTSCSWVCGRLTECKLTTSQRCSEMCAGAASTDHPLRIGRESCAEIKKAFVTSSWTCWAEGSAGYSYGNGPWEYRNTSIPANGRTRDEAALEAQRGCGALVGAGDNLHYLDGAAVDSGMCKVTRCFPPGSPLF